MNDRLSELSEAEIEAEAKKKEMEANEEKEAAERIRKHIGFLGQDIQFLNGKGWSISHDGRDLNLDVRELKIWRQPVQEEL